MPRAPRWPSRIGGAAMITDILGGPVRSGCDARKFYGESIQVKVPNWFASVGTFFGFFQSFLKLFLQKIGGMLLRFDGLTENRLTTAVLLLHGFRGLLDVIEHLGTNRRGVADHSFFDCIYLEHSATARTGYFERGCVLGHDEIIQQTAA